MGDERNIEKDKYQNVLNEVNEMTPTYSTISQAERSAIDNINSAADLDVWNKKIGLSDDCEIPAFEEFDPAVPIQRGRRTTVKKSTTENGTIKSINSITSETSDNGIVEIKVKALYDYKAKEEDEIDLKKGQILTQMKPGDDQGWALGRLPDGTEGV